MADNQQLLARLDKLRGSRTVIVGIGNILKGDDAAGPLICQQLTDAVIDAEIIDAGTVPENYIGTIIKKAPENLLVIDAVDFQAQPGAVKLFRAEQLSSFALSTHTLSPHLFVDTIVQQTNAEVYFIGIQPAQTELAQSMSPPVSKTCRHIAAQLIELFAEKNDVR